MYAAAHLAGGKTACHTAHGERAMTLRRQSGFTYLLVLWWVAISGVMLAALAQSWQMAARREQEAELQFRGAQIKAAIEAYAKVPVASGASQLPLRLEDLLADTRTGILKRHLRQVWADPITGGAWGLIREGKGIRGVYSPSNRAPLSAPKNVPRYRDWFFQAATANGNSNDESGSSTNRH